MKISWQPGEHGGWVGDDIDRFLGAAGYRLSVYVDGVRQYFVLAVDTEAGTCVKCATDAADQFIWIRVPDSPLRMKAETLRGKVRVEIERAE